MKSEKSKPISFNTIKRNSKLFGFMPEEKKDVEEAEEEEIIEEDISKVSK